MNGREAISERTAVRSQAAAWLALLQSEDRTAADEAGFRLWLRQSPEHQQAFDSLTTAWETAGGLAGDYPVDRLLRAHPPRNRRLAFAAASICGLAVAIGVGWMVLDAPKAYATAAGETRRLAFADGSTVVLDSASAIEVKLRRGRRDFRLERGRAHFEVAKDPDRPFVVSAGQRRVVALGTVFNVATTPAETSVVLLEGKVAVESGAAWGERAPARILHAGERLTFDGAGLVRQDRPNMPKLTAWEHGQALFDDDTVASAVAELNRYSRRPLVIEDPQIAAMRVSGVFRAGATEDFAVSISSLLPIKAWVGQDRIVLRGGGRVQDSPDIARP